MIPSVKMSMDTQRKSNHGNPAYPPDFKFNELPKNNWHIPTKADKDAAVERTMEHVLEAYRDIHTKD